MIVQMLLRKGANVDAQGGYYSTTPQAASDIDGSLDAAIAALVPITFLVV